MRAGVLSSRRKALTALTVRGPFSRVRLTAETTLNFRPLPYTDRGTLLLFTRETSSNATRPGHSLLYRRPHRPPPPSTATGTGRGERGGGEGGRGVVGGTQRGNPVRVDPPAATVGAGVSVRTTTGKTRSLTPAHAGRPQGRPEGSRGPRQAPRPSRAVGGSESFIVLSRVRHPFTLGPDPLRSPSQESHLSGTSRPLPSVPKTWSYPFPGHPSPRHQIAERHSWVLPAPEVSTQPMCLGRS